jgi:DNA polymerase-3 subunit delta
MPEKSLPVIYLFYGDDDFAISQQLAQLQEKMGDPSTAGLNITWLDGRTATLNEVRNAALAMPFLVGRRLVIFTYPLASLKSPSNRQAFLDLLKDIPSTTALILVIEDELRRGKWQNLSPDHWLLKWVSEQAQHDKGQAVLARVFAIPVGPELARWIQQQAERAGGKITERAAFTLAELVGGDPRMANQEITKLLAYVNYQRPIEAEDVEDITTNIRQENIFDFVDTLGGRDGKQAVRMLSRLLEKQDAQYVFAMIVRQFRLLIETEDVLENGGSEAKVAQITRLPNSIARKLMAQAGRFSRTGLDSIYHQLLEIDEATKTGHDEGEVGLYTLVAALTQ